MRWNERWLPGVEGERPVVETIALSVLFLSASYLVIRFGDVSLRASRSRRAYANCFTSVEECDDRVLGSLVGLASGDAVGLPAESLPGWLIRLRYPSGPRLRAGVVRWMRRAGDISDDTQLSIAVGRSVLPGGKYCHERFLDELRRFRVFSVGAGPGTLKAAAQLYRRRTAKTGANNSAGNGVAIRIAPLALSIESQTDLLRAVEQNGIATHGGRDAIVAAQLLALLIHEAKIDGIDLVRPESFDRTVHAFAERVGFPLERYERAVVERSIEEQLRYVGLSAHCLQSVTAVLLLVRAFGLDFRAACQTAFVLGGDVDSVCSMTGALMGAAGGLDVIPEDWRAVSCEGELRTLARRLDQVALEALRGKVVHTEGDVAVQDVDVVINAWNRNVVPVWLLIPQGVSRAIRRAGGKRAIEEVSHMPALPLGGAVETPGHGLGVPWVIHTAGINVLWTASERSVTDSVRTSLLLARSLGARSVAVPLIGAGSGRLSREKAQKLIERQCELARGWFDEVRIVSLRN